MKAATALLVVLGLLLGPGYYLYCEHLSGRDTASFELGQRGERWTLPDGSIQRFPGRLAYRPVVLDLHPERNRVRLSLAFHMPADGPPKAVNAYQATLFDLDHPLLQRALDVTVHPGATETTQVGTIAVNSPVQHLFLLEELGPVALAPARVTITVREAVDRPVMPLVWTGIAMLLAGVGFAVYGRIWRQR